MAKIKVNALNELYNVLECAVDMSLTTREIMLWNALIHIEAKRVRREYDGRNYLWEDGYIPISNEELSIYSKLDRHGIEEVRNKLKQRGIIDFLPGDRRKSVPRYKINYTAIIEDDSSPKDMPMIYPKIHLMIYPKIRPKAYRLYII